jgi:hypothetical protein
MDDMNAPWLSEEMARSRMADVERQSMAHQRMTGGTRQPGWSRHLGEALIRAGQRLAG